MVHFGEHQNFTFGELPQIALLQAIFYYYQILFTQVAIYHTIMSKSLGARFFRIIYNIYLTLIFR